MDNGINFEDNKLTNIVIMAWDRITFIQMLGRKRVDINNAQEINLYIATRFKKSFLSKLMTCKKKQAEIDLFNNDKNQFNRNYDNSLTSIAKMEDLFYRNHIDGEWKVNLIGDLRLILDTKAFEKIAEEFKIFGAFTFIFTQLEWLGLEETWDETNLIEDVILEDDIMCLEEYLESIIDKKVLEDEQIKLKELLMNEAFKIDRNLLQGVKKMHVDTFNSILEKTLKLNYKATATKTSRRVDGKPKKYTYWTIIKTVQ